MIEVSIYSLIKATERVEMVVSAIEKIFPGLTMDIREDRVEAYNGVECLMTFHKLLREQKILDTSRSIMLEGLLGSAVQFRLNKQAALMGKVNFPPVEEPLGSIHVQITIGTGGQRIIDWLAPKTENGMPIRELDISEVIEDV